ncbi:hypothetical protein SMZ97_002495 [Cronobacter turicensis]|nr:hypothetical protein [Cronobacter turicensis]
MSEMFDYWFTVKGNVTIIKIALGDHMACMIQALEYGASEGGPFTNEGMAATTVIQKIPTPEDADYQLYAMTSGQYEHELDAIAGERQKRISLSTLVQTSLSGPYSPSEMH